jgi:hypothetical protein
MANLSASLTVAAFGVLAAVVSTSCDTSNAPPPTLPDANAATPTDAGTTEAAPDGAATDAATEAAPSSETDAEAEAAD